MQPVTLSATRLWNPWSTEKEFSVCIHNTEQVLDPHTRPKEKGLPWRWEINSPSYFVSQAFVCIFTTSPTSAWTFGIYSYPWNTYIPCFPLLHNHLQLKDVVCLFKVPRNLSVYLGQALFHLCLYSGEPPVSLQCKYFSKRAISLWNGNIRRLYICPVAWFLAFHELWFI